MEKEIQIIIGYCILFWALFFLVINLINGIYGFNHNEVVIDTKTCIEFSKKNHCTLEIINKFDNYEKTCIMRNCINLSKTRWDYNK